MQLSNSWPDNSQGPFDCIIVGGAAVGMSLACLLANAGWKVGVLEAGTTLPGKGRKIALSTASQELLAQLEIWPSLASIIAPIAQVEISLAKHWARTHLKHPERPGEPIGYVCPLDKLHDALLARCEQLPSLHYAQEAAVSAVCPIDDGWRLTLADGSSCDTRLLVGADGTGSFVRQQMGIALHTHDYDQGGLVCQATFSQALSGRAFERFTNNSALAVLPLNTHDAAIVWSMPSAEAKALAALPIEEVKNKIQKVFGYSLGHLRALSPPLVVPFVFAEAHSQIARRCVLVGNAAHTLHPIAAQGFNLSLRDVSVLAEHCFAAAERGDDWGSPAVLSGYLNARLPDQRQVIAATDVLARYVATNHFPAKWRALGLLSFALVPPLRHAAVRLGMEGSHV